jgi:hypothetical protein
MYLKNEDKNGSKNHVFRHQILGQKRAIFLLKKMNNLFKQFSRN